MLLTTTDPKPNTNFGPVSWLRIARRAIPLILMITLGMILLLTLRLVERPVFGARRPLTPYITQAVCRSAFWLLGIGFRTEGTPLGGPGAVVSNHSSWLDILALNASKRIYFVAKSEVASWPGIGWLARANGTIFIRRSRQEAAAQVAVFRERLALGHRLLFFPEGTSTDGLQVLPFKPTLFAAFFDESLRDTLAIQPVTLVYTAPPGADPRSYGWWGDMPLVPHLLGALAAPVQGWVLVRYHAPVRVADYADRKALAAAVETIVRNGLHT